MRISSVSYEIDSTKEMIKVTFKVPSVEGINVRDLYSDIGTALSYRGSEIDRALPRDADGNIIGA